ncbi:MAG: 4-hydroxy-tetrahydrodipicolinate synthase [Cyclobacteriaceae bacterium]|nr:4-hydroxy-tetrahydrodipicolinate synthase [Cyclobacteriaceae bacterium HetDA_MAG_MS6]
MSKRFKGTGVALVTPFTKENTIDYPGIEKILNHVVDGGVDYLVVHGTTAESPTLTWQEKLDILTFVQDRKGDIPLVLGLAGNNTSELLEKYSKIESYQFDAILSASPFYNKPSQAGIILHYQALADISKVPVILYNIPHRTASNLSTETTLELSRHDNIIGTKESSGDMMQCSEIAAGKDQDFLLISGDDAQTLPILSLGGDGIISVAANCIPELFCQMVKSAQENDFHTASEIHQQLTPIFKLLATEGNPTSIKAAMEVVKLCRGDVRLPLTKGTDGLMTQLKSELAVIKKG